MDGARLLAGLDADQRRAVTDPGQPLCILAGAGSGKTRVLTRRIAFRVQEGSADPRHVLALTFTRKAATEMGVRLARLGLRDRPHVGTLHAMAWAQLRMWRLDKGKSLPGLLQLKMPLVRDLPSRGAVPVRELIAEIEWALSRNLTPEQYSHAAKQEDRRPPTSYDHIAVLIAEYDRAKRQRGVIDFDDMLRWCADLFDEDPDFARIQRWRFRHFFVDEFQDLNPLQHRLLMGWTGDSKDLCVVGDPNQAIYRWNGADATFLTRFADLNPGATVIRLSSNYRSSPEILHLAGAVLGGGGVGGQTARRSSAELPVFHGYGDEREEAKGVAAAARILHGPGTRWDQQAVLVRTNAQIAAFETAFTRARIPFRVRIAEPLGGRSDVRAALREVAPNDAHPLHAAVVDLSDYVAEQRTDRDRSGERAEALDSLLRLAHEFSALEPLANVGDFKAWMLTAMGLDGPGGADAVHIVTFHAAKGLEWPVVHLTGFEAGLVPISFARSPEAEAEERRLLHVAMTRAERVLRVSWAHHRTIRSSEVNRRPSPYLDLLLAARTDIEQLLKTDPERGLEAARDALQRARAEDVDRMLLEALREWRAEVARRAGTAPAVVASDRVLSDVAHRRPTDREELAAILGIGPAVVDTHGDDLLRIVSSHAAAAGAP